MIALTFTSGMNASLDVTSVLTRVVKALSFWKNVKLERLNVCMLIGDGGPAVPVVVHGVRASALMV
ncbi:hypothetical protein [Deinococcus yavapaiensis]|nr:hypothetical protein [Deinococcus yavapaiensis]